MKREIFIIALICTALHLDADTSLVTRVSNYIQNYSPKTGWGKMIIDEYTENAYLYLSTYPPIHHMFQPAEYKEGTYPDTTLMSQVGPDELRPLYTNALAISDISGIYWLSRYFSTANPTLDDIYELCAHVRVDSENTHFNTYPVQFSAVETSLTNLVLLDAIHSYLYSYIVRMSHAEIRELLSVLLELYEKNQGVNQKLVFENIVMLCYQRLRANEEFMDARRRECVRHLHDDNAKWFACFAPTSTIHIREIPTNHAYTLNELLCHHVNVNGKRTYPLFSEDILYGLECPGVFPEKTNVADFIELVMERALIDININCTNYSIGTNTVSVFEVYRTSQGIDKRKDTHK